jgi:hypothetical protein
MVLADFDPGDAGRAERITAWREQKVVESAVGA